MIRNHLKTIILKNKEISRNVFRFMWGQSNNAELDIEYLCNPKNLSIIESNIANRKGVGNIQMVNQLKAKLDEDSSSENLRKQLHDELLHIPNKTHPQILDYGEHPKLVKKLNEMPNFSFKPKDFYEISKRLNLARTSQLGNVCGNRSYYILGNLAELEHALVNYFLENLVNCGFELITVPDILPRSLIENCGMSTKGERNQVYSLNSQLHGPDLCLSGTSEISLAGFLSNNLFELEELPKKLTAVSRCYRAETSNIAEQRGIFRVHEFTKVEMFLVTSEMSDEYLEEIREIQERLFESLGLHCQVLDMPPHELGAQAYRKYDIEAWIPARGIYGEISSCSNCTDYQSRRLNIKYKAKDGITKFVHTLNGTACAIPRLLIALTETGQDENGLVHIPNVLQKYMRNKTQISRQKKIPELKLTKNKKDQSLVHAS